MQNIDTETLKYKYKHELTSLITVESQKDRCKALEGLAQMIEIGQALGCSSELHNILKERVGKLKW